MSTIRFLSRNEIDETKWNALINKAAFSLPYALSWYLDQVAEHWGALVLDDYKAALPLVWLSKLRIKLIYQPYYCQQLGFFSAETLSLHQMKELLQMANKKFPYINTQLNPAAALISNQAGFSLKKNLLLALDKNYLKIKKNYSENHRRNIAKATKAGFNFSENIELKAFQIFYLENINRPKENFKKKHETIFLNLSKTLLAGKHGKVFGALNAEGKLQAATLTVFHQNRIINIINTSSAAGKKNGASHFVFDQLIQKFSDTEYALDFEGSSVPSIARFYEGFGATPEVFYNYKYSIIQHPSRLFAK